MNRYTDHSELMIKVLSDNASEAEREQLNRLLESSEDAREAYGELQRLWLRTSNFTPRPKVDKAAAWKAIQNRIDKKENKGKLINLRVLGWVAAAAVIVLGLFIYVPNQSQEFSGQVTPIAVLNDGTSVDLDEASEVIFEENKDQRLVQLKGKATFDVKRNETKPFIVQTETYKLQVLGTSFEMQGNADSSFVRVLSGIVKVRSFDGDEQVLYKGDEWWSDNGSWNLRRSPMSAVSWQFNDEPIGQVLKRLESVYWQRIEINSNMENCRLSAKMSKANLREVIETIELTLGAESTTQGDTIYLSGDGCF